MFDPLVNSSIGRDVLAAVVGLCVGSFLNVLALRSLKEQSLIWPPSSCPNCNERIKMYDLVPVLSYLLLNGKCRNCRKPIHWVYPFVEVFTACTFVVLLHMFGPNFNAEPTFMDYGKLVGMATFCSTLIAICITDFREKLIPHEITYPSMLLGIAYSGIVRNDLQGALMGIGVSYILFDFLAFYGLQYYIWRYGDPNDPEEKRKAVLINRERDGILLTGPDPDRHIHHTLYSPPRAIEDETFDDDEEFSVMGGGDAVLSAVMAAWIGIQALAIALMVAFLVGTVMGAVYLVYEMFRAKILNKCIKPALIGMVVVVGLVEGMLFFMKSLCNGFYIDLPFLQMGIMAAVGGALLGVLKSGHDVSKPFPFGPSLAFGAVVALITKSMYFPGAP